MNNYVNVIQFALYHAALQEQHRVGNAEDKWVAAALANLLTGKEDTSSHTDEQRRLARAQAAKLLVDDQVRLAAVMCLRTTAATGAGATVPEVAEVVRWVSTIGEIPPSAPNPDIMRRLQYEMAKKYCPGAERPDAWQR
jgi:acyl-CoA reductase-like NAD-dependent aldehyde dehydrogenase